MKFSCVFLVLLLSSLTFPAFADNLEVQIEGVNDLELTNIRLYLGKLPQTNSERTNYLFSAKANTEKALQAFGYFNSQIETHIDKKTEPWKLKIQISTLEKITIRSVNILINGEAQNEPAFQKILSEHLFLIDTPLDQQKYESLKSALLNKGTELGFFDAQLSTSSLKVNRVKNQVDIELIYDSGNRYQFGKVQLDEVDLQPWILQSLIPFSEGEKYNSEKLFQLQQQLQQSNYLSAIMVQPLLEQAENYQVPVKASFKPAKSHSFDIGLGFATDTKERLTFGWKTPKINSYGHNQEAKISYSTINPSGEIKYNIPISHPYNDVLQFGLRLEDDDFGAISSKQYSAQVNRTQNQDGWIRTYFLRYQKELWDSNLLNLQANYVVPGLTLTRTTKTGSAIDPTSGFSQVYTLEATDPSIGSDTRLIRLTGKFKWINKIAENHRLVSRTYLGLVQVAEDDINLIAPSLRFFAGGDQSIRGFSYQSLGPSEQRVNEANETYSAVIGGSRIATASFEYQYYFNDQWRIPLFVDAGQAFDQEKFSPIISIGSGIHYLSPIGAIRIEIGYGISEENPPWRIHFTMGAEL